MLTTLFVAAGAAIAAGALILLVRAYRVSGAMVVTCPETSRPAAVRLDWKRLALGEAVGAPELRLRDCSRWPERQGCGQDCLLQIESSPESCLVRTILTRWYRERRCAYCGKRFGEIHWHDHKPALLGPDGRTVEWAAIPAEAVFEALATHRPVCWNCHGIETFRREHPDLVIERPPRLGARPGH